MLNGIDVSKWQLKMDWAKAKAAGVQFAIVRAGSIDDVTGVCYEDYQYRNNIAGLNEQSIPYALYWYFRPNHSVGAQHAYFLDLAKDATLGKMLVDLYCDIEVAGDAAKVKAFCETLAKSYPTGIYTNLNTVKYLLTGYKSWMASYTLWLADYTAPYPPPDPWKSWAVLQYSSTGDAKKYGSPAKNIDLDYALDWMLPPVAPPPPPAEHSHPDIIGVVQGLEIKLGEFMSRVEALENIKPGSMPFAYFVPKGGSCVIQHASKWYKTSSGIDKPIFAPVGSGTHPKITAKARVFPLPVTGDGGQVCYMLLDQMIDGETVYVRRQDGALE